MTPRCCVHEAAEAVTKCYKCGKDLCENCRVDYHGKDICVECGKPLLYAFEPMLYNNPDILQPKTKFTDYAENGRIKITRH